MKNDQKGSASAILIVLIVILAAAVVYFAFIKKPQTQYEQIPVSTTTSQSGEQTKTPVSQSSGQQVQTVIYVPKNQAAYDQLVSNDEEGTQPGTASLTSSDFVAQNVTVITTPTYSIEQATADAAAATVKSQTVIKTIGFKIVGNTAYVILNINVDGWAGVSYSIDRVNPIIKQTLLHFSGIKGVEIGTQAAFKATGVPTP